MALLYIVTVLATSLLPMAEAEAARGDRVLDLYYTHTKERKQFTFRKRGKYDQRVLKELNVFLRDWRRSEPTNMDPALFDLVWEVYQDTRATGPIHVVSAYRSPATNSMLRSRSSGVAKNSQHTKGRAMDFFIPGMHMRNVRDAGLRRQVGGVGYYPRSNTPFVHLDTGSVRHWPRMSRTELAKVFPKGDTVHIPSDGKPFGGYNLAMAQIEKRARTAQRFRPGQDDEEESESGGGFFAKLFGRRDETPEPARQRAPARAAAPARPAPQPAAPEPVQVAQPARPVLPPMPGIRPRGLPSGLPSALPAPAVEEPILQEPSVVVATLAPPPTPRLRPASVVAVAALGGANGLPAPVVEDPIAATVEADVEANPTRASLVALAALPRTRPSQPSVTLASLSPSEPRVPQGTTQGTTQASAFAPADPIAQLAGAPSPATGKMDEKIVARIQPGTLPVAATAYAPAVGSARANSTRAKAEAIIPVREAAPKLDARVVSKAAPAIEMRHHKGPAYRQLLSGSVSVKGKDVAWLAAPTAASDLLRGSAVAPSGFGRALAGPSVGSFSGSALR